MDTDVFFRNLEEKHAAIIVALDQYFAVTITDATREAKDQALIELAVLAGQLAEQIASADRPQWLTMLATQGGTREAYPKRADVWQQIFDTIKNHENSIREHKWLRTRSDTPPLIDFDEIVAKHRNREVVEKLFDNLITSLEKLIACDELDSRRVVADLERLLATIRKSKLGSFHSQLLSVNVAKAYTRNLVKSWVCNTKIAKIIIEAADKTVDELGLTLDEAREKIQTEISSIEQSLVNRLSESAPKALPSEPKKK